MATRKALGILLAAATLAAFPLSQNAVAASYNGVCESSNGGEICLYDARDTTGRVYDTLYSKASYTGTYYGTDISIDNSINSTWNRDPDTIVWFFKGANYTGLSMGNSPGWKANWSGAEGNAWSSHCFANNSACPG
ncbi:peptidase inhibitor family I36 protein [Streptomyces sp. 43Y-GA-1]|uniref:peptidase inhibitor family I36 protein n=1 Tax=Streptomyces sp. 43Y-GA-1 TaxID=2939435 RepID=UPI0034D42B69